MKHVFVISTAAKRNFVTIYPLFMLFFYMVLVFIGRINFIYYLLIYILQLIKATVGHFAHLVMSHVQFYLLVSNIRSEFIIAN